jgi:hypothetical protein
MNTKPILFWPKPRSAIEGHLDRGMDDFSVVDTNCVYDLEKLYKIKRTTPIFDPFPQSGTHYRDFKDHVVASDCSFHIVGLKACRNVLRALNDPSLAHSSMDELLAVTKPAGSSFRFPTFQRSVKLPVDWSYLNAPNTILLAILVFMAALIGNMVFLDNGLIAAIVATGVFAALYVGLRIGFRFD